MNMEKKVYDFLIIGYGPAGISAALYALRSGHSVQIVGYDGGALAKAHLIENYYGLATPVSGKELLEIGKSQARQLGAEISEDQITDLFFDGNLFVASSKEKQYSGRVCILATGAARKKQPFAGLSRLEGHGVSYCAVCDAFFYRQKNVAVLGSGEYALHEASELKQVASSVTILTNGNELEFENTEGFIIENRKIESLLGNEKFEGIRFDDNTENLYDGLFVAIGSASATDLARKAGAAFENGKLVLDENFQSSIPGLFAAGDCTGGTLQIAVAVAEGAEAALAANKFLRENLK